MARGKKKQRKPKTQTNNQRPFQNQNTRHYSRRGRGPAIGYWILYLHYHLWHSIFDFSHYLAKLTGRTAFHVHMMLPFLTAWAWVISFIFGGCCSNVYALETIIKAEPTSGLLVTFFQFFIVSLFTWPSFFSIRRPPFFLKRLSIPLVRWVPSILMFFTVNLMNNMAFGYNISVPVHIILRSGGSVLTMLVGWLWGKRYTRIQVLSVFMLTVGIIVAAMADARAKGKMSSADSALTFDANVLMGLAILFIAQLISAIMGLYIQLTYAKYGSHWLENLFYSHLLSIPLFLPFTGALTDQFNKLLATSSPILAPSAPQKVDGSSISQNSGPDPMLLIPSLTDTPVPPLLVALGLNALTQYACIRGVNLLAAQTSALGVTIVLNVRKLVSLFVSIWMFGNRLPLGVSIGAAIVFTSAGLFAWESQRIKKKEKAKKTE